MWNLWYYCGRHQGAFSHTIWYILWANFCQGCPVYFWAVVDRNRKPVGEATLTDRNWITHPLRILLGLWSAPKEDLQSSSAELVFSQSVKALGKILSDACVSKPTTACQAPFWAVTSIFARSSLARPKSFGVDMGESLEWVSIDVLKPAHVILDELVELAPPSCCCRPPNSATVLLLSSFSSPRLWSALPPTGLKHRDRRWPQFPIHLWWLRRVVFGVGSLIPHKGLNSVLVICVGCFFFFFFLFLLSFSF